MRYLGAELDVVRQVFVVDFLRNLTEEMNVSVQDQADFPRRRLVVLAIPIVTFVHRFLGFCQLRLLHDAHDFGRPLRDSQ